MTHSPHNILADFLFPTRTGTSRVGKPILHGIGLLGFFFCLVGLLGGKSLQNFGMGMLLIATIGCGRALWPILKRDPFFKIIAVWTLYVTFRTAFALFEFPETAEDQIREGAGMLRIALILIFAWWMGGALKAAIHTYIFVLFGLLITLLLRIDWLHLPTFLDGNPMALNIHHSNVGLLFATAFIGWIIFAKTIWGKPGRNHKIRIGLWSLVLALLLQGVLLSQLRIIWVGVLLWGFCMLLFLALKYMRPQAEKNMMRQGALAVSIIVVTVSSVFSQFNMVSARLSQEQDVVKKVLEWDLAGVPATSIGARIHFWKTGLSHVKERFLFGWGPGTTPALIQKSNIPKETKIGHTHTHNTFLELFVRLGLIGFLLLGSAFGLIIRSLITLSKEGPPYFEISVFSLSALFLFGIACLTDSYFRQVGWFLFAILGGVPYSFLLWEGLQDPKDRNEPQ